MQTADQYNAIKSPLIGNIQFDKQSEWLIGSLEPLQSNQLVEAS